jgi:glycosyltransferase involved in cell wall biosynthesis
MERGMMMEKVSILTHSFLDGYNANFTRIFAGGLERYLYDLCTVIKELGFQPVVHQLAYFDAFSTTYEDIEVHGYPYEFDEVVEAFESMAERAEGALIYASCIWHPIRYKKGSLGICHGLNWDRHDLVMESKRYVAQSIQNALSTLKKIVSVDSHFLSFCRAACQYSEAEQVVLLPNSVDTDHFRPGDRKPRSEETVRILFPRRISYERGTVPMMLAADALLDRYPQVVIEFVGERVQKSSIGEAFDLWREEHPHRDRIEHKTYPFEQVISAYQRSDLVVIPSIFSEGTSYSCLEAISCGVPVVASNVGGLNDIIIDGYNGLLIPPTEERLIQAISHLVENRDARIVMGRRARETAFAFEKKAWKQKWRDILLEYLVSA